MSDPPSPDDPARDRDRERDTGTPAEDADPQAVDEGGVADVVTNTGLDDDASAPSG